MQTNVLFSEQPFSRKSLLTPIASDRRPKWSTPRLRCPFSNARSCCTEISASAASRSCVQPFSRRLPRILLPTCTLHNSYSVVLSAATQRFGRRNWVLFAILPAIKMLSPFPHTRIMHADSNSTLFHKSEFAHKLPQSIFSVKSFFAAERDKFTQQTHKNEYLHSNYTYFTINSFQKHQYVLVCSANISNFLRFSQVSFSRFHAKNQTPMVFNKHI